MKTFIIILLSGISVTANAQVKKVTLQASGLTCSMCSNAINKSLRSIDYVEKVTANISTSTFDITFKPGATVNFDQLKKKVEDAGFFVASFTASVHFNNIGMENDSHVVVDNTTYHFLNSKDRVLNGDVDIRVLDKGYVSSKEFKRNQKFTAMTCYQTGVAASCCAKDGLKEGSRIFHVTI